MKAKFLLFLLYLPFLLSAQGSRKVPLEWGEVPFTKYYSLEVKDGSGKVVYARKTKKTLLLVDLQNGMYEYRVGAVNSLEQVGWSKWYRITVKEREGILKKRIKLEWQAGGQNLYKLEIVDKDNKIILSKYSEKNSLYVDLEEGKYRYRVTSENKLGFTASSKWQTLEVRKRQTETYRWPQVLWRSALLPGWGQYYRGDTWYRYTAYPVLMLPLALAIYPVYQENQKSKRDYDSQILNALLLQEVSAGDEVVSLLANNTLLEAETKKGRINSTHSLGNALTLGIGLLYLVNIVDAIFFFDYSKPVEKRTLFPLFSIHSKQEVLPDQRLQDKVDIGFRKAF